MSTTTVSDLQRVAVSILGTVLLSATCVLGAVAPARAETPATLKVVVAKGTATGLVGAIRY